jgi:hypothetical protein
VHANWGDRNLVIVARPKGSIELVVTDTKTGSPVMISELRCTAEPRAAEGWISAGDRTHLEWRDGRCYLHGLSAGTHWLLVKADRQAFHPGAITRFHRAPGTTPVVQIEFGDCYKVPITVGYVDGRPAGDTRIRCLHVFDPALPPKETTPTANPNSLLLADFEPENAWLLADTFTDSNGRGRLWLPPTRRAVYVAVFGFGHAPLLHGPVFLGDHPSPLHLVVSSSDPEAEASARR